MALGSLLLQPQALRRLQTLDAQQALADDLVALLRQVLVDPEHLESLAPAFEKAFTQLGGRLRTRLEGRLDRALDELRSLVEPLTRKADQLGAQGQGLESAGKALELASALLEQLRDALDALTEPQLRTFARRIHDLITGTLGLNQTVFEDELRQVFSTLRAELLAGVAQLPADRAGIHLALAAFIGRLETELMPSWPRLDLSPDRLAQRLMQGLREAGLDDLRAQLQCLLERLQAALGAGSALITLAKPSAFGPGSVGAAQPRPPLSGDKYCWYASWLYATRRQSGATALLPGYPADEVWLSADGSQLILRRAFSDDEVLHERAGGNLQWQQAPQFTSAASPECFTFGVVSPGFLETWTQVFAVLTEFGKAVGHIIACATSPREHAANVPLIIWNLAKSFGSGLAEAPLPAYLTKRAGWGVGSEWLYIWVPWLSVLLGSLEGLHSKTNGTNKFLQWLTLLGGDALNAFTIHGLASGANDVMLSLWTLMNYQGPAGKPDGEDTRPRNREHGGPLIGLSVTGANWLLMKLIPREDYAHPFFAGNNKFYLWWLLCSPLMGAGGGLLGTLLVWAISRTYDWEQLGKEIGLGALRAWGSFIVQQYTTMEGDTDDGKYNPKLNPDGNDYSPARQPFAGYPPAASSPYRLPYAKGEAMYVGQANQGMFSHMRFNWLPQVYAYDFAHDFGDEILAARGGTVVDFFDWIDDDINPDNTQVTNAYNASVTVMGALWRGDMPGWNFIVVRHDTAVDAHDRDVNDQPTTTYAVYGHGKNGSIRAVFNARGVAPGAIIGTQVQRGQVIMLAGDTGVSFHNHLHMHVRGGPAPPAAPPPNPAPIADASLTQYTLPFVFREARHVIGRDGVLRNLTWYRSDNEKVN